MRQKRFLHYLMSGLLGGWLFVACTAPEDKQPDNLISEAQMTAILTDIHLAESQVSRMALGSSDSSNIVYKRLEKQIFKKFKVDTSAYTKSYVFYSSHPRQMEEIYKQVVENLKKKTEEQQKQIHTQKPTHP